MSSRSNSTWFERRAPTPEKLRQARAILEEVRQGREVTEAIRRHPLSNGGYVGKNMLVAVYRQLTQSGDWPEDARLLERIRLKPIRTLSGVTTVTVLTKPYACPGKCVFCPTDVRMPKSYLPDEPGARRALENQFDPYQQVRARIHALESVGHPTQKIELLILGGTWSAYPRRYQEWFVKRCLDAMNLQEAETLLEAQLNNETSLHRNVGLVVETRPDEISVEELLWLRRLGVTKVQLGAQSLDDRILELNQRGHSVAQTHRAVALLRSAGFKIVLHWMPNLLGATLDTDRQDFMRLWKGLCPDEIKIYPTQLLENAALYQHWLQGDYQPYTTEELIDLIAELKTTIPRYCRVNRVVRDIPSTYVIAGNKRTSLRQDVKAEMHRRGTHCQCVRCREIRNATVDFDRLVLNDLVYPSEAGEEHFLSMDTPDDRLAGFLRLSLPDGTTAPIDELRGAALVREVHILGQSLPIGDLAQSAVQHGGLGGKLLREAETIARNRGYTRLAVISAIGTRRYYLKNGFRRGELYLLKELF